MSKNPFHREVKGVYYLGEYTFEELIEELKQSIKENPNDPSCYFYLGNTYYDIRKFDLAYEFFKKAESLESREYELISIYDRIGSILFEKGDFDGALEYYSRALELAEKTYAIGIKFDAIRRIAYIYYTQGKIDESLELYKKSLSLCRDKELEFIILNNIAILYHKKKYYKRAIKYFKKAIEIGTQLGFHHRVVKSKLDLADVFIDMGNYNTAIIHIIDVLIDTIESDDKYGEANAHWLLGKFYYFKDNNELAIKNLEQAYSLFKEIGSDEKAMKVLESIDIVNGITKDN